MRVTNNMISRTVLNNLSADLSRLQKTQDQMSSGQVVSRPSDDPVVTARVMTLDSVMAQHDQYDRNMNDAQAWLETTDKALGSLTSALQRARTLTIAGANDSLSSTDRNALAQEIDQLTGNVVQIANTSYANRYIFAGTKTTTVPFDSSGNYVAGNTGTLDWEVSQGVKITVNIDGNNAFNPTSITPITSDGSSRIFNMLHDLKAALTNGTSADIANLSGKILGNLDSAIDNTLNLRAEVGAKSNRLQMALNQSAAETLNYKELKSKLNDVDMVKAITDFNMQESVYQAALNTAAQIIQPSLLNFLK